MSLSRVVVPGGRVRIELVNLGEDPHDLKLRRIGGRYTYTIPETLPGERSTKTLRLIRGRYRVWCAVAGHRDWGMRATLRVVPGRSRPRPRPLVRLDGRTPSSSPSCAHR